MRVSRLQIDSSVDDDDERRGKDGLSNEVEEQNVVFKEVEEEENSDVSKCDEE